LYVIEIVRSEVVRLSFVFNSLKNKLTTYIYTWQGNQIKTKYRLNNIIKQTVIIISKLSSKDKNNNIIKKSW